MAWKQQGWGLHPGVVSVSVVLTSLCSEIRAWEWGVRSCIFMLICKEILKRHSLKLPFMRGENKDYKEYKENKSCQ